MSTELRVEGLKKGEKFKADQKLEDLSEELKLWLQMDRGSPNMTSVTKEVTQEFANTPNEKKIDKFKFFSY